MIGKKTVITDLRMGVGSVSKRVCECVRVRVRTNVILIVSNTVWPKSARAKCVVGNCPNNRVFDQCLVYRQRAPSSWCNLRSVGLRGAWAISAKILGRWRTVATVENR